MMAGSSFVGPIPFSSREKVGLFMEPPVNNSVTLVSPISLRANQDKTLEKKLDSSGKRNGIDPSNNPPNNLVQLFHVPKLEETSTESIGQRVIRIERPRLGPSGNSANQMSQVNQSAQNGGVKSPEISSMVVSYQLSPESTYLRKVIDEDGYERFLSIRQTTVTKVTT